MNTYLLFKSLHLIAVISWMAGLLYLPRIFVYHSQNNDKPLVSDVFKVMEQKLFFYIMTPAMTLSWIFGLVLIHEIGFEQLGQKWMILKLVFVIILTLYHFYLISLHFFLSRAPLTSPASWVTLKTIHTMIVLCMIFHMMYFVFWFLNKIELN